MGERPGDTGPRQLGKICKQVPNTNANAHHMQGSIQRTPPNSDYLEFIRGGDNPLKGEKAGGIYVKKKVFRNIGGQMWRKVNRVRDFVEDGKMEGGRPSLIQINSKKVGDHRKGWLS